MSADGRATVEQLQRLNGLLLEHLVTELAMGKASAAVLDVARQYLKQNAYALDAGNGQEQFREALDRLSLPFTNTDDDENKQ
jgi:hypothetical protein